MTDADLGNEAFPWLRAREIRVAGQAVRALRVSYVGELGWELHPSLEALPALYDALWEAGRELGIANYGLYAVNTMRIEKGYKAWSTELTNELNMLEADVAFHQFQEDRLHRQGGDPRAGPPPAAHRVCRGGGGRRADARGGEPVLREDHCIGVITSGAYGHRVKKSLAFACVTPEFAAPGCRFDVLIQGERRAATVLATPAFDPDNARMRA